MPEKEPPIKIRRLFGLERLRSRLPRSLCRKLPASPLEEMVLKLALLLFLSLGLALILSPRTPVTSRQYRVGDIARENVKAIRGFLVEDVETTAKRQQELLAQIPPVFDLQEQMADKVQQRLHKAMDYLRSLLPAANAGRLASGSRARTRGDVSYKMLLEHKAEFDQIMGVAIPNFTFSLLAKTDLSPYLEAMTSQVLGQFFNQGVISSRTVLQPPPKEILVRRLPSQREQLEQAPFSLWKSMRAEKPSPAIAGRWQQTSRPRNACWYAIWPSICWCPMSRSTWPKPASSKKPK